jgi:hypothetical protein
LGSYGSKILRLILVPLLSLPPWEPGHQHKMVYITGKWGFSVGIQFISSLVELPAPFSTGQAVACRSAMDAPPDLMVTLPALEEHSVQFFIARCSNMVERAPYKKNRANSAALSSDHYHSC